MSRRPRRRRAKASGRRAADAIERREMMTDFRAAWGLPEPAQTEGAANTVSEILGQAAVDCALACEYCGKVFDDTDTLEYIEIHVALEHGVRGRRAIKLKTVPR